MSERDSKVRVIMVGPFPPPMHGMAAVNAAVHDRLRTAGVDLCVCDVAAPNLDRRLLPRLKRLPRIARALVVLALVRKRLGAALYLSVSGGWGQVYDALFVALARARGMRVFMHHHSYAYLDRRSRVTALLVGVAGADAVHVLLSRGMAERMRSVYPRVSQARVVSNAALLLASAAHAPATRARLCTLGFLGNLTPEKGVLVFLDVCEALQARRLAIRCVLAGPFPDIDVERTVRGRLAHLPMVEYVGPKYGEAKKAFFADLDALLFPTRYVNEAEPLVIHEALRAGVPVIAYARGAIGEMVDASCGLAVRPEADFVSAAVAHIVAWKDNPDGFLAASRDAVVHAGALHETAAQAWRVLEGELVGAQAETSAVELKARGSL